jgi:hypothetical protein
LLEQGKKQQMEEERLKQITDDVGDARMVNGDGRQP